MANNTPKNIELVAEVMQQVSDSVATDFMLCSFSASFILYTTYWSSTKESAMKKIVEDCGRKLADYEVHISPSGDQLSVTVHLVPLPDKVALSLYRQGYINVY